MDAAEGTGIRNIGGRSICGQYDVLDGREVAVDHARRVRRHDFIESVLCCYCRGHVHVPHRIDGECFRVVDLGG